MKRKHKPIEVNQFMQKNRSTNADSMSSIFCKINRNAKLKAELIKFLNKHDNTLSKQIKFVYCQEKKLIIQVISSVWATKLRFLANDILEFVQQKTKQPFEALKILIFNEEFDRQEPAINNNVSNTAKQNLEIISKLFE